MMAAATTNVPMSDAVLGAVGNAAIVYLLQSKLVLIMHTHPVDTQEAPWWAWGEVVMSLDQHSRFNQR